MQRNDKCMVLRLKLEHQLPVVFNELFLPNITAAFSEATPTIFSKGISLALRHFLKRLYKLSAEVYLASR